MRGSLEVARSLPLFGGTPHGRLEGIAPRLREIAFDAEDRIHREGDACDRVAFVVDGAIRVAKAAPRGGRSRSTRSSRSSRACSSCRQRWAAAATPPGPWRRPAAARSPSPRTRSSRCSRWIPACSATSSASSPRAWRA